MQHHNHIGHHAKRVTRDLQNLFSHDFSSRVASLSACDASEMPNSMLDVDVSRACSGAILHTVQLNVCIYEGPYRGGHFIFYIFIPETYPFKGVDVSVDMSRPIWHPNIDLDTGRVVLPLEWSPVLTLSSLALAIQMMLLEPSVDNPLNLEACSYYSSSSVAFEECVQKTMCGCIHGHLKFVAMNEISCQQCYQHHSDLTLNRKQDNQVFASDFNSIAGLSQEFGAMEADSEDDMQRDDCSIKVEPTSLPSQLKHNKKTCVPRKQKIERNDIYTYAAGGSSPAAQPRGKRACGQSEWANRNQTQTESVKQPNSGTKRSLFHRDNDPLTGSSLNQSLMEENSYENLPHNHNNLMNSNSLESVMKDMSSRSGEIVGNQNTKRYKINVEK